MSHEMRTPLAGVIGMLGFALRDGYLKDSTREQILRGQANAQSLLAIINDLLDFSKIEAGKLTIENIDFALDESIEHVVTLFEEQAGAHSVGFALHLDEDLPRFVVGDPTRLRQVLVNLVGNAFKFTESGTVTVRVERRPATSRRRAPQHDPLLGRGHRHRHRGGRLPRLFQKFEQADADHHAALRRHRPGPGDLPPAGRADGRQHRRHQHPGRAPPSASCCRWPTACSRRWWSSSRASRTPTACACCAPRTTRPTRSSCA
jgi:hypothetical protein